MAIVTIPQAKTFLNTQDEIDEGELNDLIAAITPIVEREVGPVDSRSVTSVVFSDGRAALPIQNIQSLTTITVRATGESVDPAGVEVVNSILQRIDGAPLPVGRLQVVYEVGMYPVPGNITYGALEVLKLARAAQVNKELPAFLLSYRASAWFAPDTKLLGFA